MKTTTFNINGKEYQVDGIRISGHAGSYNIEGIINGETYKGFTHNASLKDDYNEDESYFEDENSGHWFNSAAEVEQALVEILVKQNDL